MAKLSKNKPLARGIRLAGLWFVWFFAGFGYALTQGGGVALIEGLSTPGLIGLGLWAVVSIILLFLAVLAILRGMRRAGTQP